ncbi:hypothetical protein Lalb_Chr12g0202091 [Lupinus albus]|uniref:Uncharacterized protein n=1 Tax=Lupinus albus TaxID=3870 RepID=A0A6A4PMZ9_LUPAL|nr:hypothetical protein Lalb_Chr12g0202091 [Lupinus albus]
MRRRLRVRRRARQPRKDLILCSSLILRIILNILERVCGSAAVESRVL